MITDNGVEMKITQIPIYEELHAGVYIRPSSSYLLLTKKDIHKLISELNDVLLAEIGQEGGWQ